MVIRPGVSAFIRCAEGVLLQKRDDNGLWGRPRGRGARLHQIVLPALLLASRFFVMGDGTLSLVNAHTDDRATVHYRRKDGSYAADELARLRHVVRSQGDAREIDVPLRLVEVLAWLQHTAGGKPLVVLSGYRSPDYNQDLKAQGRAVAGGSLHTEGLAADLAFPRTDLPRLWHRVRDLDCCGAGYYAKEGFLHVDVGRPRFWEATTSRVDENLSAGNARMFARTEFDRYATGAGVVVTPAPATGTASRAAGRDCARAKDVARAGFWRTRTGGALTLLPVMSEAHGTARPGSREWGR